MFAAMVVEQEPITLADLPGVANHWVQIVGGLAMGGIILWMIFVLPFMRRSERLRIPQGLSNLFLACVGIAAICYVIYGVSLVFAPTKTSSAATANPAAPPTPAPPTPLTWRDHVLSVGGAFALLAACLPILRNLSGVRMRRIWALARHSFQEALRKKVLYEFSLLLVFFLFASWFITAKPEAQVHAYVNSVFGYMTFFLLVIAVFISAFSIPTDIKQQTIHTILTKPVERFEIVLGRFLGFMALMTLVLLFMATISLLYVVRGVDPDAARESLKARAALYGDLSFEGTASDKHGESVGREWAYRTYVGAKVPGQIGDQYAIWSFPDIPRTFANRTTIPCEFTFDIYRTNKGDENVGIFCTLVFTSWNYHKENDADYRAERNRERTKTTERDSDAEIDNKLAAKYGYYEVPNFSVSDFHTMTVPVPGGLFAYAAKPDEARKAERSRRNEPTTGIQVRVQCTSPAQFIGMAKYDMYFRADDPDSGHDRLWFAWNFYKAAFGLWLRLCLVVALSVVLSTYLSGVISLLVTALLYLLGIFVAFIQEVGAGKNVGGGPIEAALRLGRRDNLAAPLEQNTLNSLATKSDDYYRVFLQRVLNVIPDVYSSDLVAFVEEGFNIGPEKLLVAAVLLLGYTLPWFLLGYYLLKWREIASST